MSVTIKSFDVEMVVKNKGVEMGVYDNNEKFLGDLVITKSGLIWCQGRTSRENGVKVKWSEFIEWMES